MRVCVIGVGYVGLTSAAVLAELGHQVICVDKDNIKITRLTRGHIPIYEPGLQELINKNRDRLTFMETLSSALEKSDVILIAVGTPPRNDGSTNLDFIYQVINDIAPNISSYKTLIIKSTVPPGTNESIRKYLIEKGVPNSIFDISSNPEFLREGTALNDALFPDRIIVGIREEDINSLPIIKELYKGIDAPIIVTTLNGAELIKYASNAFLATKISFINEIARICEVYNVDVNEIATGIGVDPRIGKQFFQAGIGYGGSCFPKDLKSLRHSAKIKNVETPILDAVEQINDTQIETYINKLIKFIPDLSSKIVTVLGFSFKPDTDDTRCSPSLKMIESLSKLGCNIKTYDPRALLPDYLLPRVQYHNNLESCFDEADCIIIATDWEEFKFIDWQNVKKKMRGNIILDGRNCLDKNLIVEYGLRYIGVGRS